MKYFSMFSGVGGFELGIQQVMFDKKLGDINGKKSALSGHDKSNTGSKPNKRQSATCVGYSEIDKYAIETYEHNWKGHTNYGDATTINAGDLPDFDLLVGGFPCQAFSVAGKRLGFDETRGTLFFDIARILSDKRPRHFLLENVKGLLSHDSGKTFQTIIGVLTDLGYVVEWQVLNSKDFGVPQNRERIFIIGHLGIDCSGQVFPITGDKHEATFGTIHRSYHKGQHTGSYIAETKKGKIDVVGELDNETWQKRHESIRRVYDPSGIAPTTPTGTGGGVMTKIAVDMTLRAIDGHRVRQDGRAGTLDANYYKGIANQERPGVLENAKIRRLTPLECERLMGWPDNWTIGSDTQRYKQCGNGVVSNCVQAVIDRMKPCLA